MKVYVIIRREYESIRPRAVFASTEKEKAEEEILRLRSENKRKGYVCDEVELS